MSIVHFQRTIRRLVQKCDFDPELDYRHQDAEKLGRLFKLVSLFWVNDYLLYGLCNSPSLPQARRQHPVLAMAKGNWATSELTRQYLKNNRKYLKRKSVLSADVDESDKENESTHPSDDDEDEDMEDVMAGGESS